MISPYAEFLRALRKTLNFFQHDITIDYYNVMKKTLLMFSCVIFLLTAGTSHAGKINVVVSIYPLKDIAEQVGGDMVNVDFMVPSGASPHTFEPTPSDMIKISKAGIFVIIGSGLEFWAEKAIKAAGRKELRVITLSRGLPLIQASHMENNKHLRRDAADPHIWLDPLLTKEIADRIKSALIEIDTSHKTYFTERAEGFKKELDALHIKITGSVNTFKTKEYVTFHPAWNYFSRRYGLKVIGVIEESPGKEASPKHIAKIIKYIAKTGSKVIFAEPQFNPKIAEVIAKEAGAKVLFLDPIGGPGAKDRDTYISLMSYNLSILEKAMR